PTRRTTEAPPQHSGRRGRTSGPRGPGSALTTAPFAYKRQRFLDHILAHCAALVRLQVGALLGPGVPTKLGKSCFVREAPGWEIFPLYRHRTGTLADVCVPEML